MDKIIIIPARLASSRLAHKLLLKKDNKPIIQHTYELAIQTGYKAIIATDSPNIEETCIDFGADVILSSSAHNTGTDRVAEAAKLFNAEIIINLQGDEPTLRPEHIIRAVDKLEKTPDAAMSTLATTVSIQSLHNYNVVKVTLHNGYACWFSRESYGVFDSITKPIQHIGLYVYRRHWLEYIVTQPQTAEEKRESLEQLRTIHHGGRIIVEIIDKPEHTSIDTPEDFHRWTHE